MLSIWIDLSSHSRCFNIFIVVKSSNGRYARETVAVARNINCRLMTIDISNLDFFFIHSIPIIIDDQKQRLLKLNSTRWNKFMKINNKKKKWSGEKKKKHEQIDSSTGISLFTQFQSFCYILLDAQIAHCANFELLDSIN